MEEQFRAMISRLLECAEERQLRIIYHFVKGLCA